MAKGMAIPVRHNGRGGARVLSGSPLTKQIVSVGLTPNTSNNPFQEGGGVDVGVSESMIFDVNGPSAKAKARRDVVRFFARIRVEDVAKLATGDEGLSFEVRGEELIANVRYIELESDRPDQVNSNMTDAFRSSPGDVGGVV